jgi:hypothetical protein
VLAGMQRLSLVIGVAGALAAETAVLKRLMWLE